MPARPFKKKALLKLKTRRKRGQESFENSNNVVSPSKKQKTKAEKHQETSVDKFRKRHLLEINKEEDKTIKRMEKLLKLNKKKKRSLPSEFRNEGLDYILDAIERKEGKTILSDDSDDLEDDLAVVTSSAKPQNKKASKTDITPLQRPQPKNRTLTELLREKKGKVSSDKSDESEQSESDEESEIFHGESDKEADYKSDDLNSGHDELSEEESNADASNGEDSNAGNQDSDDGFDDANETSKPSRKKEKPKIWEDIYGRLRDEKGNVINNTTSSTNLYIPPKLRDTNGTIDESKKENCLRIKRQLKGLLNRLSESNLQNIGHQIEEMYMKNSRNDMNDTLFSLVSELVFTSSMTPPRLIMEQAMLVALLHANVGPEVGAFFLQYITKKLGDLLKDTENYGQGKECNNVIVFLSHLYDYKVTHSTLIFDIFRRLVDSFSSKDIELIQLLLKSIGFRMRKDDPLQLKELIVLIQSKAPTFNNEENDSRVKFMLETLTAIRNNNMYKIPDYDPSITDHSKKSLRGMIRKGCSVQELNISFDDLISAESRGRWWIVGSAWAQSEDQGSKNVKTAKESIVLPKTEVSEKILELARKQHMNTEVRKSVFCILMTAEDFMDAFEKLLRLNLKNQQEREIIHVILHCAVQEKNFNPYYAFLLERFCKFARKHLMCLQFALWDKFKELSKMRPHQINNLSRLLSQMFTSDSLPLSVLKVIHFSEMDKTMVKFFRQILLSLLLHDSEEVCLRAFVRIAAADNLKMLRESLKLFMHHFVLRNQGKLEPELAARLQQRVKAAERTLKVAKRIV